MVFGFGRKKSTESIENLKKLKKLLEALRRNDTIYSQVPPTVDKTPENDFSDRGTSNREIIDTASKQIEEFENGIIEKVSNITSQLLQSNLEIRNRLPSSMGRSVDSRLMIKDEKAKKQLEEIKQQLRILIQE
ncbi:MAG: hypothetical protein ACLFPL_02125 [Candidatus Nanoarchaeia archaeon]